MPTQSSRKKHRILVVDDDRDFAEATAEALEMLGYQVAIANTFSDALAASKHEPVDGVLLDLRLGEHNGLDLLPSLRRQLPNVVCVIVTAFADMDSAINALRHHVDDYLPKPVSSRNLDRVLQSCFSRIAASRLSLAERKRENIFGRLLVRRFADLFEESGHAPQEQRVLSRHMLPSFFVAVDMMLGPDRVNNFQQRCQRIVKRLTGNSDGEGFVWDKFYDDDEAKRIALEAEVDMAVHFANLDQRLKWLTNLINNHIQPSTQDGPDTPQPMSVGDAALLIANLFSDLVRALSTVDGRDQVARLYNRETCDTLVGVTNELARRTVS